MKMVANITRKYTLHNLVSNQGKTPSLFHEKLCQSNFFRYLNQNLFFLNFALVSLETLEVTNPSNQETSRVVSVTRSCAKSPEQADEFCKDTGFSFCDSCSTDGCNSGSQFGPIALMAAVPVAIAKLFLHYVA